MKAKEMKSEQEACMFCIHPEALGVEVLHQPFVGPFMFCRVSLPPLLEHERGLVSKMTFSPSLNMPFF